MSPATASNGKATTEKAARKGKAVTSEILDRQPPQDIDSEKGVLGSILLKSEILTEIGATISPRDFYDEAHQKLYAHMLAIHAAGQHVDLTLLADRLNRSGDFELIGGAGNLAALLRFVPHAGNAKHYAGIVREKAGLRRIILSATEALRGAYCELPLVDVEAQLQAALEDISPHTLKFERLTSAELSASDDQVEYLIDDVWPKGQCGIISAVFKALKTGTAVDAVISLATATPFLGYFLVRRAVRCGIMSAESGRASLKERGRAIAASKGWDLDDISELLWSTSSPRLARAEHLAALKRFIVDDKLEALVIDPTYLALCDIGDSASNVFKMGAVLGELTELSRQTGCSIVLVNHNRKGRDRTTAKDAPPELAEISMSGFAEWARFWILLGPRQEWDRERGQHWLWLSTGGSAGHAGLWHLDVTEGKRSDPGGRRWEASIVGASEGSRNAAEARKTAKADAERKQLEEDKAEILQAFAAWPVGNSKSAVREDLHMGKRFNVAFAELRKDGSLIPTLVVKGNNRSFNGFRIKPDEGER